MADHHREMVFCHECENEWYRDEHGLTCPDCTSEFTEIIEAEHDPRDDHLNNNHDDELEDLTANPWTAPDPDESVPNMPAGFRLQRNGPNSFAITGTWSTAFAGPGGDNAGGQHPTNPLNPLFRNFTSMMQGITGATAPRSPPHGEHHEGHHQEGQTEPGAAREETRHGAGPRYTYTSTARLFPRDANSPGPHVPPTDDLHHVIAGILGGGAFGPPGFAPGEGPRYDDPFGSGGGGGMPRANPLAALFASILNPQLAAHGDAVYTQEALDRVISQLMEQNATGNAPGPASAEAIAALPRKTVTRKMVGADAPADWPEDQLKGECSICMDEVPIGETVTELPCSHWFHGACIEAWLKEHDTCPHCRKGIEKKDEGQGNGGSGGSGDNGSGSGAAGGGSGGFGSSSPGAGPSNNDGGFGSGGFGSGGFGSGGAGAGAGHDDFYTGGMPNIPGGWQAAMGPVPNTRAQMSPLARALILAIQNLERGQVGFMGAAHPYNRYQQQQQHQYGQTQHNYIPDEDFILLRHVVRSRDQQPRQRRRSSLRGWFGNAGNAGSGGEERLGLGERIRRSLFGGAAS